MIQKLIMTFELFLTKLTVKLSLILLFITVLIYMDLIIICIISLLHFLVIFFNLSKSFLLYLLFNFFHFLFFPFLLFLLFFFESLPLFFFLLLLHEVFSVTRIPLFEEGNEILNSFDVVLFLLYSFFLVLLLHFSLYISVLSIPSVPFVHPHEALVGGEVLPVIIELEHSFLDCFGVSESLVLPHFGFVLVLSVGKSLCFFGFYLFEDLPVNLEEPSLLIAIALETGGGEVGPDVEPETVLL